MSKIITIVSGKGGAGKTTLAVYLGRALAARGKAVLLVEMDAGLRGMDLMLGVASAAVYDLSDVLCGRCKPSQAVMLAPGAQGLHLLAAANDPGYIPDSAAFEGFLGLCRSCYDFILFDSPAGFGRGFALSASACTLALAVAVPEPVSVRACARAGQLLCRYGDAQQRLIINKVPPRLRGVEDLDAVIDGAGIQLIGAVPLDCELETAAMQGRGLNPCPAGAAIENIAARLCGEYRDLLLQ